MPYMIRRKVASPIPSQNVEQGPYPTWSEAEVDRRELFARDEFHIVPVGEPAATVHVSPERQEFTIVPLGDDRDVEEPTATVQAYSDQIDEAARRLDRGEIAKLTVSGYAVTRYVRWVTDVDDRSIYATWQRDHLTEEVTGGPTLALSLGAHRRAAAMTYAELENATLQL